MKTAEERWVEIRQAVELGDYGKVRKLIGEHCKQRRASWWRGEGFSNSPKEKVKVS